MFHYSFAPLPKFLRNSLLFRFPPLIETELNDHHRLALVKKQKTYCKNTKQIYVHAISHIYMKIPHHLYMQLCASIRLLNSWKWVLSTNKRLSDVDINRKVYTFVQRSWLPRVKRWSDRNKNILQLQIQTLLNTTHPHWQHSYIYKQNRYIRYSTHTSYLLYYYTYTYPIIVLRRFIRGSNLIAVSRSSMQH